MKPTADTTHFATGFTGKTETETDGSPSRVSSYAVRALVCAFAILLLWITSLNLSKVFVTSIIHAPNSDTVVQSWNDLGSATLSSKDAYSACAAQQLIGCNSTLNRQVATMLITINANQASNQEVLFDAAILAQQCSQLVLEIINSINSWQELSANNQLKFNTSACSPTEIANVQAMVQNSNTIDNKAYILAQSYSDAQDARTQRMIDFAKNYTQYNEDYINSKLGISLNAYDQLAALAPKFTDQLGNITDSMKQPTAHLVDCISMSAASAASCPNGARAGWNSASAPVQAAYTDTYQKLSQTVSLYRGVTSTMKAMLNAVENFFQYVLLPVQSGLVALGINLGSFPSTSYAVPLIGTPNGIPSWFDPDALTPNINTHVADWNTAVAQATARTRATAGAWWANQSSIVNPNLFSDYNPPQYVPYAEQEQQQQQSESAQFRINSAVALNQQASISVSDVPTANVTVAFLTHAISPTDFKFQPLGGNLLLAPLLNVIPNLYVFLLVIDYVFRGYRSVRLIIKYWFKSAVGLPVIDVREYENHAGPRGPVKAVSILTHPLFIAGVILLIVALALASIIPPYNSLYQEYVNGCVKSDDGTVLSNNTFAIAYNYASSDGNKILTEGFQTYDANRNQECGAHVQSTTDTSNQNNANLGSSQASQRDSRYRLELFQRCLNFSVFPSSYLAYNTSTSGHRHPLLILNDAFKAPSAPCPQAKMDQYVLLPAYFNCSNLPQCPVSCLAPRAPVATNSKRAGCETEYMIHSFIARFWVTILVFVSLNLSRMLFMAAVVRLGWRSLTPMGFEFVSNCTRVGETSKTINQHLVTQLNKAIANYERFAIFLFGLALLIHVPYIVVLSTLNQTLEYK